MGGTGIFAGKCLKKVIKQIGPKIWPPASEVLDPIVSGGREKQRDRGRKTEAERQIQTEIHIETETKTETGETDRETDTDREAKTGFFDDETTGFLVLRFEVLCNVM